MMMMQQDGRNDAATTTSPMTTDSNPPQQHPHQQQQQAYMSQQQQQQQQARQYMQPPPPPPPQQPPPQQQQQQPRQQQQGTTTTTTAAQRGPAASVTTTGGGGGGGGSGSGSTTATTTSSSGGGGGCECDDLCRGYTFYGQPGYDGCGGGGGGGSGGRGARYVLVERVKVYPTLVFRAIQERPTDSGAGQIVGETCAVRATRERDVDALALRNVQVMSAVAAHSRHPNLLSLRDWAVCGGWVLVVTELIPGGEQLFQHIIAQHQQQQQLPSHTRQIPSHHQLYNTTDERYAARVVSQILSAVAHLHSLGYAHRNITPENILCSNTEPLRVVLGHFELSKNFREESLMTSAVGTLQYAAPEILMTTGRPYTSAVDMWSVGCLTFVLLTGGYPWQGDTPEQFLTQIFTGEYNAGALKSAGVSSQAHKFIQDLIVVEPEGRLTAPQALVHPWILANAGDGSVHSSTTTTPSSSPGTFSVPSPSTPQGSRKRNLSPPRSPMTPIITTMGAINISLDPSQDQSPPQQPQVQQPAQGKKSRRGKKKTTKG
ncbi:calcium/calmodulin-dependent protein kinase I [Pelomyxa schiedti]|nr:calcium/calmodulin-dependent protein kinase I [Pelomyxa schiedti]